MLNSDRRSSFDPQSDFRQTRPLTDKELALAKKTPFDSEAWTKRLHSASEYAQISIWGRFVKQRQKMDDAYRTYSSIRKELLKARTVMFKDRPPVPLVPYVTAPLYIVRTPELSHGAARVFLNLISYTMDKRTAWPSQSRQAADLHVTVRQIQRYLLELVRKGFIQVGVRRVARNTHVNQYILNLVDTRDRSK